MDREVWGTWNKALVILTCQQWCSKLGQGLW